MYENEIAYRINKITVLEKLHKWIRKVLEIDKD